MFCGNCGREIKNGTRFCPACGKPVEIRGQGQISGIQRNRGEKSKKKRTEYGTVVAVLLAVIVLVVAAAVTLLYLSGRHSENQQDEYVHMVEEAETKNSESAESSKETEFNTEMAAATEKGQKSMICKEYYEKLKELQQIYGKGKMSEIQYDDKASYGDWRGEYLSGLCFAGLKDFNRDGQEELVTVYLDSEKDTYENVTAIHDYVMEIWGYNGFICEKIYSGTVYLPHQGFIDEAILLTSVDQVPYIVQGSDDITYSFWGYDGNSFKEVKALENDWVELSGYRIDDREVSESEYDSEFDKWWKNCKAYKVVDFSNPDFENKYSEPSTLETVKLMSSENLNSTLSELTETFRKLAEEAGIEETEETYGYQGESEIAEDMLEKESETQEKVMIYADSDTKRTEIAATRPQVQTSCISGIEATSVLSESTITHYAERICDGDLDTAWVEGVSGQGIGESISIRFDNVYCVDGIKIHGGYQKSSDLYYKNSRPSELEIELSDGTMIECFLEDYYGEQNVRFSKTMETSWIRLTIKDVYAGSRYEDTSISEIEVY